MPGLVLLLFCLADIAIVAAGAGAAAAGATTSSSGAASLRVALGVAASMDERGDGVQQGQQERQQERQQLKCCWCSNTQADLSHLLSCVGCSFGTGGASAALEPVCAECYNKVHQQQDPRCGGTQQPFLARRVCTRPECAAAAVVFCEPCHRHWCDSCSSIIHSKQELRGHKPVDVGPVVAISGEQSQCLW
jgi:hypothetical protein